MPAIIIIFNTNGTIAETVSGETTLYVFNTNPLSTEWAKVYSGGNAGTSKELYIKKSSSGKSFYWYADGVAQQQNTSSAVYNYVVIG